MPTETHEPPSNEPIQTTSEHTRIRIPKGILSLWREDDIWSLEVSDQTVGFSFFCKEEQAQWFKSNALTSYELGRFRFGDVMTIWIHACYESSILDLVASRLRDALFATNRSLEQVDVCMVSSFSE